MGTPSSRYRIRTDEPNDFRERKRIWLALQYQLNTAPEPEFLFSYKTATQAAEDPELIESWAARAGWSEFMTQEQLVESLDISIQEDATVVVQTVGPNLMWSLAKDAIMTLHDRKRLYGELGYWNNGQWLAREDYDLASCQRIQFKAALNDDTGDDKHKFSYNVRLRNKLGRMIEHEIDPDIRNPSLNL